VPYPYDPLNLKEEEQEPAQSIPLACMILVFVAIGLPALFQIYVLVFMFWTWMFEGAAKLPDI
jgi:hypothetical protein